MGTGAASHAHSVCTALGLATTSRVTVSAWPASSAHFATKCVPVANSGKPVLRSVCALTMAPATPLTALASASQVGLETTVHRFVP